MEQTAANRLRDTTDWTDDDWLICQHMVQSIHEHRFVTITVKVTHSEVSTVNTEFSLNVSKLVCDLAEGR